MKTKNGKLPLISQIGYGIGDSSFTFGTAVTGFYLLIFLTNVVGLRGWMASGIIFIGFVWDAVTDPIVGHLSDGIRSKFGRRRTLMLASVIPLALSFFAVFGVSALIANLSPDWLGIGETGIMFLKAFLVLIIYLFYYLMYTLAYMPYIALINDMTKDYKQRTRLTGFRMVFTIIATIVAVAVPDLIIGDVSITHSGEKFILISAIFGVLMVVILLFCIFSTFELPTEQKPERTKFRFRKYFADCWKNKPFRQSAFAFMFSLAAIFVVQDIIQYYVNYWLRSPELFLPLAGSVLVIGFLSVPLWVFVSNKIGKRNGLFVGAACWVVSLFMLAFLPQQGYAGIALDFQNELYVVPLSMGEAIAAFPLWGWLAVLILGFGMGNIHLTAYGMYPDAISLIAKEHPELEGSHFGAVSFLQKVGIGFATLVIGPILDLTGYVAGPGSTWQAALADAGFSIQTTWLYIQPGTSAPEAIKWLFVALPVLLILMAALSVKNYRIDALLNQ